MCTLADCPLCYENIRARANHKGHRRYRAPVRRWRDCAMGLRRASNVDPVGGTEFAASVAADLALSVPTLTEFLARCQWDDGTERQPGTLLVCCQDGLWKAWVNDKAQGRTAWVSAATLVDLLALVEDGLDSDELPWRRASVEASRARGRRG